jgi:hypothetical protein
MVEPFPLLTYFIVHSFIDACIQHSFITHVHSFIHLFICSFIYSHSLFLHSFIHSSFNSSALHHDRHGTQSLLIFTISKSSNHLLSFFMHHPLISAALYYFVRCFVLRIFPERTFLPATRQRAVAERMRLLPPAAVPLTATAPVTAAARLPHRHMFMWLPRDVFSRLLSFLDASARYREREERRGDETRREERRGRRGEERRGEIGEAGRGVERIGEERRKHET